MPRTIATLLALGLALRADGPFVERETWHETLRATRAMLREVVERQGAKETVEWAMFWRRVAERFPDATAAGLSRSLPLPEAPSVPGLSLHVATDGNDANPGTEDQPFRTLERARDAIRALPRTRPITVWIHGGTYELARPLRLEPQDSGTAQAPITYRAMPGEPTALSSWPQ